MATASGSEPEVVESSCSIAGVIADADAAQTPEQIAMCTLWSFVALFDDTPHLATMRQAALTAVLHVNTAAGRNNVAAAHSYASSPLFDINEAGHVAFARNLLLNSKPEE